MGMLDGGMMGGSSCCGTPQLEFEVKPRVFVRNPGEEYAEISGVKSFERSDDSGTAMISFGLAEGLGGAAQDILQDAEGKLVDVKMEFMIGMLMVMTFSGFVEQVSADKFSFSVSTPITTDVADVAQ